MHHVGPKSAPAGSPGSEPALPGAGGPLVWTSRGWWVLTSMLVLAAAFGGFQLVMLRRHIRLEARESLSGVADLKVRQIEQWRGERLADARFFASALFVSRDVRALLGNTAASHPARAEVLDWLALLKGDRYVRVAVLDPYLGVRLAMPDGDDSIADGQRNVCAWAGVLGRPVFSDFFPGGKAGEPLLALCAPVHAAPGDGASGLVALILLELDPGKILYPLLQSWPTPSRTAETLLVRREGSEVVYLNELRHERGAALSRRRPIESPDLVGAMAAHGETGLREGVDYRGVPVIAAIRSVSGTPWYMVAKVDRAEIDAPVRASALLTGTVLVLFLVGVVLVLRDLAAERRAADVLVVARDRDELERRVEERTRALQEANGELEAFSYSVSHDLRAPLRHVSGYVDLLQHHLDPVLDDKGKRYATAISEATAHLGQLVDDLLAFSRMGRAELRRVEIDMRSFVQEAITEAESEAPGREIVWAVGKLPDVQADPQMLRLVFANLLSNAVKYTRGRAPARIELGAEDRGRDRVFFVRDNGAGFDMRYADKLFGVFQRLHGASEFEGTGIGLASVRRIVARHGGRTWARGAVGQGATFYFSLPRDGEEAAA